MGKRVLLTLLLALSALHLAAQTTDYAFRRFGDQALSAAELAQIARLVSGTAQRPWLIYTQQTMIRNSRFASLFLAPDVPRGRVPRGRMHRLVAERPSSGPARWSWRIRESHPYAYVPDAGLRPGDIPSDGDASWPFVLEGEFDDDTLISLAEFLRTQPPIPAPPASLRIVPAAPISDVRRDGDAVVVDFRTDLASRFSVKLVRKDGRWVITDYEYAIE